MEVTLIGVTARDDAGTSLDITDGTKALQVSMSQRGRRVSMTLSRHYARQIRDLLDGFLKGRPMEHEWAPETVGGHAPFCEHPGGHNPRASWCSTESGMQYSDAWIQDHPESAKRNPFVRFTLRVAGVRKDGDVITTGCIHCGYPGDPDIPDEGCPHGEHEFGRRYTLTPETAWRELTTLIGEARALSGSPAIASEGVWIEIEIPEED